MPDVQSIKKQLHMQQWTAIIEDRIASGLKIDEYCEKNQLSRNSYFYWLRKIREEMSTSVLPDHNDLLPASVSTKALVAGLQLIQITTGHFHRKSWTKQLKNICRHMRCLLEKNLHNYCISYYKNKNTKGSAFNCRSFY